MCLVRGVFRSIGCCALNNLGFTTGNCVQSVQNTSLDVCEIHAWCPEELTNSV
jgi:hypothetical protein